MAPGRYWQLRYHLPEQTEGTVSDLWVLALSAHRKQLLHPKPRCFKVLIPAGHFGSHTSLTLSCNQNKPHPRHVQPTIWLGHLIKEKITGHIAGPLERQIKIQAKQRIGNSDYICNQCPFQRLSCLQSYMRIHLTDYFPSPLNYAGVGLLEV